MLDSLPLGPARLERPESVFRYTFEHFAHGLQRQADGLPTSTQLSIVPVDAVAAGDAQVLAAREQDKERTPVIDLDVLADFPALKSVVASTRLRASRTFGNCCCPPGARLAARDELRGRKSDRKRGEEKEPGARQETGLGHRSGSRGRLRGFRV